MKEQNYYEIKGSGYNFYPVKLIKLTDFDFTIETLLEKKQNTLNRKYYILRELSILQSHLNRLGFENKNEIQTVEGINLFPVYMVLGKDNMNLKFPYFGHKVIEASNLDIFKEKYSNKLNELKKLTDQEYDERYLEIQNQIKIEFGLITNINELFKKLESLNFSVLNKDEIITGK